MPVIASADLIAEPEGAVRCGSPARHVRVLRQVAGLFLGGGDRLNDDQVFDFTVKVVLTDHCFAEAGVAS